MFEAAVASSPADSAGAVWQRWQMQEVVAGWMDAPGDDGDPTQSAASCNTLRLVNGVVKKDVALPKVGKKTDKDQTRADGQSRGRAEGREQGYKEGRQSGYEEGYKAGQQAGHEVGHEVGHKAGYEAGYEAGYASGQAAGEQAARQAIEAQAQQQIAQIVQQRAERLDALLGSAQTRLTQLGAQLHEALAQSVLDLALGIAQQVVQTTLKVDPAALLATVQQVLHSQPEQAQGANLRLYVHPDDEQILAPFLQALPGRADWQIITDKSITPGGCVLHTALGQVDATLQTRWQRVSEKLKHELAQYAAQHGARADTDLRQVRA